LALADVFLGCYRCIELLDAFPRFLQLLLELLQELLLLLSAPLFSCIFHPSLTLLLGCTFQLLLLLLLLFLLQVVVQCRGNQEYTAMLSDRIRNKPNQW
jgi:hypothetical protein